MREPVVILGGGIGGLACAVALQKHGLACHVFEQAPRLEEVGAGLLLTPNAVAVLEALNLLAQLRPHALITPAWHILDPQGRDLQVLRPFPSGQPALSTRRSDLQRVLAGALAGESLHLDHEATSLVLQQDGVRVRFRDRADVVAPLVVVADGAASRLRRALPRARPLRDQGYVGWRALVDRAPAGWSDGRVTETWGSGRRFGIAAVGGGRTYWYASANTDLIEPYNALSRRELLAGLFHGWHAPVEELIAASDDEAVLQHPIADSGPIASWSAWGRVAMLGDAAHPLTPNLGQGAAMALEDAWTLARCLATDRPIDKALKHYRQHRRGRVAVVWAASRLLGQVIQVTEPWQEALRAAVLRATPDRLASATLRRLFRFATD